MLAQSAYKAPNHSDDQRKPGGQDNNPSAKIISLNSRRQAKLSWSELCKIESKQERLDRVSSAVLELQPEASGQERKSLLELQVLFGKAETLDPEVIDLVDQYLHSPDRYSVPANLSDLLSEVKELQAEAAKNAEQSQGSSNNQADLIKLESKLDLDRVNLGGGQTGKQLLREVKGLYAQAETGMSKLQQNLKTLVPGLDEKRLAKALKLNPARDNYLTRLKAILPELNSRKDHELKEQVLLLHRNARSLTERGDELLETLYVAVEEELEQQLVLKRHLANLEVSTGLKLVVGKVYTIVDAFGKKGTLKINKISSEQNYSDELTQKQIDKVGYSTSRILSFECEIAVDSKTTTERLDESSLLTLLNKKLKEVTDHLQISSAKTLEQVLDLDAFGQKLTVGTKLASRQGSSYGQKNVIAEEVEIKSLVEAKANQPGQIILSSPIIYVDGTKKSKLSFAEFVRWWRAAGVDLALDKAEAQRVLNALPAQVIKTHPRWVEINKEPIKLEVGTQIDNSPREPWVITQVTDDKIALNNGLVFTPTTFVQFCKANSCMPIVTAANAGNVVNPYSSKLANANLVTASTGASTPAGSGSAAGSAGSSTGSGSTPAGTPPSGPTPPTGGGSGSTPAGTPPSGPTPPTGGGSGTPPAAPVPPVAPTPPPRPAAPAKPVLEELKSPEQLEKEAKEKLEGKKTPEQKQQELVDKINAEFNGSSGADSNPEFTSNIYREAWNSVSFISWNDIVEGTELIVNRIKADLGRNAKLRLGSIGANLPGRIGREFKSMVTASENEAIQRFADGLSQDDVPTVWDKLSEATSQDEVKACIQWLADKGALRFSDTVLWDALNRVLDGRAGGRFRKISKIKYEENPDAAEDAVKNAMDFIWGKNNGEGWLKDTISHFDSGASSYNQEANAYENGYKGGVKVPAELHNMLINHIEGRDPATNPQRYYGFLKYIISQGKASIEDKLFYLLMGLYAQDKSGRTLLPRRLVSDMANSVLASLPFIEYMVRSTPLKYFKHKSGNPNTLNFPKEYMAEILSHFGMIPKANDNDSANRYNSLEINKYLWQDLLANSWTRFRVNRVMRDGKQIDHDDAQFFLPLTSPTEMKVNVLQKGQSNLPNFTPDGLANGLGGFNTMFAVAASLDTKLEDERNKDGKDFDGRAGHHLYTAEGLLEDMIPSYLLMINGLAGKTVDFKSEISNDRLFWDRKMLAGSHNVRHYVDESAAILKDFFLKIGIASPAELDVVFDVDYMYKIQDLDDGQKRKKQLEANAAMNKLIDNYLVRIKQGAVDTHKMMEVYRECVNSHNVSGVSDMGNALKEPRPWGRIWTKDYQVVDPSTVDLYRRAA